MRRLFTALWFCLLLAPSIAEAATGSAAADTWYVRPSANCANNGDGLAYGCAASAGATGAFAGISNIIWTATTGVDDGDTLYVCGSHTDMMTVGGIGSLGNNIVIDGACPDDVASIAVGGTASAAIMQVTPTGSNYVTVRNFSLSGGTVGSLYCNGGIGGCRGNLYEQNAFTATEDAKNQVRLRGLRDTTFRNNTLDGSNGTGNIGVWADVSAACTAPNCTNNLITGNTVHGYRAAGIRVQGGSVSNLIYDFGIVSNNISYDNGDGIYHVWASGVITTGNTVYGNNRTNGTGEGDGLASQESPNGIFSYNTSYANRKHGIQVYASDLQSPFTSTRIVGNHVYSNNAGNDAAFMACIFVNNSGASVNMPGTAITGNLVRGCTIGVEVGKGVAGIVANNTVVDATGEGCIYFVADADNVVVQNNLISCKGIAGIAGSDSGIGEGVTFSHNYFDTSGATTLARLETVNYGAIDIASVDAAAITGSSPFLSGEYRLHATSSARRAGLWWGNECVDVRGRPCFVPPDIGAYQSGSGDQTPGRTAR